ncbi:hypothetical protein [Candidatus Villigracilis saccharophilus]|uniref:hypothetical protein n=1 Tax=Candidatus Villigracilis saccharophilus TaxID=3140684 RepID=UPI003135F8E8|nr:hypothetical protein [Anaerolineales bacterium]
MKRIVIFLGNEILLGMLITVLSVFTALASYQGALADGNQNDAEIKGMQALNDGNAEYLTENQNISQDYNYYDNWYINQDTNPEAADYYQFNFSQQLQDAIARDPNAVWDDQYYTDMAVTSSEFFSTSESEFILATNWNERGDHLQLVLTIMAIGLAFAGWASINKEESNLRGFFSLFSIITLVIGLIYYFATPIVAG